MASLYLDHNVTHQAVVLLHRAGHQARTARAMRTEAAGDDEHLALAYVNGWILVTHNIRDFMLLHDAWLRWSALWGVEVMHPGILVLEQGRPAQELVEAIDARIRSGSVIAGELHIWRARSGWQRRVPAPRTG